jgi:hypothetical protein
MLNKVGELVSDFFQGRAYLIFLFLTFVPEPTVNQTL